MIKQRIDFFCGLLIVSLILSPARAGSQARPDMKVLEGAKKEREVVLYTTMNLAVSKPLVDKFQQKYPFIKAVLFRTDIGPLINRILSEAQAGRHSWDVLAGGGEMFLPVKDKGLLATYRSPETRMIDDDLVDRNGYWTAYTVSTHALGFNLHFVNRAEVPKTYDALLDTRWKGRQIVIDDSAIMPHALMTVWGKDKVIAYFTRLNTLDPVPERGHTLRVQLLAAGEYSLGIGLAHTLEYTRQQGAPIDWVTLEPAVVRVIITMLGARAPHSNAGKLFIDFMLSEEGQAFMKGFNRVPVRKDVLPDPPRLLTGYRRVILRPESYKELDDTQKLFDKILKSR